MQNYFSVVITRHTLSKALNFNALLYEKNYKKIGIKYFFILPDILTKNKLLPFCSIIRNL